MSDLSVITKWIVTFLVIFLLCMLLIFHFIRKRRTEQETHLKKQRPLYYLY